MLVLLLSGQSEKERKKKTLSMHVYLPEEDVTVCAEVQGITVLLSVRIAAAQLKVHLLPLQVTFI